MKKILILTLVTSCFSLAELSAKCFGFSKNKDYKVCVDGDSNASRKQAQEVCKSKSGSDCGNITGYSGSCNAGSVKCLDASGTEKKSIKVD